MASLLQAFFCLISLFSCTYCSPADNYTYYDKYQVLRVQVNSMQDAQFMRSLLESHCDEMKFPKVLGSTADILCSPEELDTVKRLLQGRGMSYNVTVDNLGPVIRSSAEPPAFLFNRSLNKKATTAMNWNNYQRYATIISWMEKLAAANPTFTSLINMGSSAEGRKLYMMKVGRSPKGKNTRAIWLDGGIHAREWISPSTVTYILNNLINNFKDGSSCSTCGNCSAIQSVDWYVAPLLNPDGYEYSHTTDRLWRKNRRTPPSGSTCFGVDLNRNWDVVGYGVGASTSPCSEVYKGTAKNSEVETKAMSSTFLKYKNNIRIYATFHSYGQMIMTPEGYTTTNPTQNNFASQITLGNNAATALKCVNPNRTYTVGPGASTLYLAGGCSDDWATLTMKIPYSFTIELPDQNSFIVPTSEIIKSGNEWWEVMKLFSRDAATQPLGPIVG